MTITYTYLLWKQSMELRRKIVHVSFSIDAGYLKFIYRSVFLTMVSRNREVNCSQISQ